MVPPKAITADLYTHVLGDLKAEAADRLDAIFQSAEKRRAVGAESGAWAKCGHRGAPCSVMAACRISSRYRTASYIATRSRSQRVVLPSISAMAEESKKLYGIILFHAVTRYMLQARCIGSQTRPHDRSKEACRSSDCFSCDHSSEA